MKNIPSVIVPIITPFDKHGSIYENGTKNLLHFLYNKGIRGVWILGSYGSFPLLSTDERKYMAALCLSITKELGMYSIVQIGSPSIETSLELSEHAQAHGADALATVLPFYFSSSIYHEDNFILYFQALLDAVEVPLFYYNNPKTTGYTPSAAFIRRLLAMGVYGMKDTTTNFLAISENIQAFKDVRPDGIYMGGSASVFLPSRFMGAPSVVCGTAVSMPELVLKLDEAVKNKDWNKSQELQHLLIKARSIQAKHVSRSMACYGIFAGRGVDVGQCRAPWIAMSIDQQNEIVSELISLGAISAS